MAYPSIVIPYRFSATSYVLRVETEGGPEDLPFGGSLTTTRNYWCYGDEQADADGGVGGEGDTLEILKTCLEEHSGITSASVSLSLSTFLISIGIDAGDDSTIKILWDHANTTLPKAIFGFDASDSALAATQTADNMPYGIWTPEREPVSPLSWETPLVGGMSRTMSGLCRTSNFGSPERVRTIDFEYIPLSKILMDYEDADATNNSLQYLWENSMMLGRRFRYYEDATNQSYDLCTMTDLHTPYRWNRGSRIFWDVSLPMMESTG